MLGGIIAHRVVARLGAGVTLRMAMVIEAATPAALALSASPLLAAAVLTLFGCHAVVWGALLASLREELAPAGLRGRAERAYRLLEYGGAAPGALLGGLLAALIVPAILTPGGRWIEISWTLWAGLVGAVVAWRTRGMILTIMAGLGTFALVGLL